MTPPITVWSTVRIAGLALVLASVLVMPASGAEPFSVFLVRHAEKQVGGDSPKDPELTPCGELRAEHLARGLASVPLRRVYSSDYRRTIATAMPVVKRGVELERYDPGQLSAVAERLLRRGEDALVVGHSNTTAVLAGLLAGTGGAAYDEAIYDRVYQVVIAGEQRRLYLFHQGFDCELP